MLCNVDVVELYPSMPHVEGLEAIREALDRRENPGVATDQSTTITNNNNSFHINANFMRSSACLVYCKKNNPGRPVVASTNCHTTKLSKFVDHFIQPLAKKVRSYIRDTTDLLYKIKDIGKIPDNALLVTMDVRSLYTNISHKEGLSALKNSLNTRSNKEPATEVLLTLMRHVLTLNCFTFNGNSYLQTSRWLCLSTLVYIYIYGATHHNNSLRLLFCILCNFDVFMYAPSNFKQSLLMKPLAETFKRMCSF